MIVYYIMCYNFGIAPVAQRIERRPPEPKARSSNLLRRAITYRILCSVPRYGRSFFVCTDGVALFRLRVFAATALHIERLHDVHAHNFVPASERVPQQHCTSRDFTMFTHITSSRPPSVCRNSTAHRDTSRCSRIASSLIQGVCYNTLHTSRYFQTFYTHRRIYRYGTR